MGNVYKSQGNYKLAIESFEQAIKCDKKSIDSYYNLGNVYKDLKNYELAINSYQYVIDHEPNAYDCHNNLGDVYQAQREYELASKSYQQAINLAPRDANPTLNLGMVVGLQGKQEESANLWKKGLELLSNSQRERLFRALYEVGIGEIERGTNSLQEILETEQPSVDDLSNVLKDAEIMARFPTKLEGIDTVIKMLQQAIQNA